MANPQPDKFTRLSNELLEAFSRLDASGSAWRLLMVVVRKTYGYQKIEDKISLTQFEEMTKLARKSVCRGLSELVELNVLTVKKEGYINKYQVQKDYEKWGSVKPVTSDQYDTKSSVKPVTKSSDQNDTYKRKKERKKLSGVPPVSSNNKDMSFKNQRRYSEEEGYKEPTINADTDELEEDLDVKGINSKTEERKKIRSNIKTLFEGAGLPKLDPKQVNWHLGHYETLLERGWSHKQIAHAFINTFTSDVWKEKIQNGEIPGMNTVEYLLRNKDPKRYATN